jgi:hypothetical protein
MNCSVLTIINKLLASKLHRLIKKFSTQLYIGWVLFIALITLLPGYTIPGNIDWNFLEMDKIIHMTVFGILTYFGCYFFTERTGFSRAVILKSFLPAILYGTAIELLQTFIPQRGFDYADLTADFIGAGLGILFFRYFVLSKYYQS